MANEHPNGERAARSLQASVGLRDVISFLKARRDYAELELYRFYGGDYIPEANPFRQRDRLERDALMFREAVDLLEKQPNPELNRSGGTTVPR